MLFHKNDNVFYPSIMNHTSLYHELVYEVASPILPALLNYHNNIVIVVLTDSVNITDRRLRKMIINDKTNSLKVNTSSH